MRRLNNEGTITHQIAFVAVDGRLGRWEVWDPAAILLVLGVSEQYNALDLVLNSGGQTRDGTGHESRTLRVAACYNGGFGAL